MEINTVGDLRRALEDFDEDTLIRFAYPAGDYWHSTIASQIRYLEEGHAKYSGYHEKLTVVDDSEQEEETGSQDGLENCVLIW
jgi:hypothetical protein